jgi:hypothetical protein
VDDEGCYELDVQSRDIDCWQATFLLNPEGCVEGTELAVVLGVAGGCV